MEAGFLLLAARTHVTRMVRGALTLCAVCLAVLLLNGRYVYNWVAGPFEVSSMLADGPATKEFGQISGPFYATPFKEQRTTTVRIFKAIAGTTTDISANFFLASVGPRFLVVKAPPEFAGGKAQGRLVPLPEALRSFSPNDSYKVKGQLVKADDLCSMMLDATSGYRTDANLFVMAAVFFLICGLLLTVRYLIQGISPRRYPMLRFVARAGQVQSTLRRIEQEFIAAGDDAHVGPLMVSSSWVYDRGRRPLLFPLKDVVGISKRVSISSKSMSCAVQFWLRGETLAHSVEGGPKDCDDILRAMNARIPWAILEPGQSLEARWRRDRPACIDEADRRRSQYQTPPAMTSKQQSAPPTPV